MNSTKFSLTDAPASEFSLACRWPGRVVIENVSPTVDAGAWRTKHVVDEYIFVEADVYSDGHDIIDCDILWRVAGDGPWRKAPMQLIENDGGEG